MSRELRLLIIDDSEQKRLRVKQQLEKRLNGISCYFASAIDYNSAVHALKSDSFDIVILDLLLPLGSGQPSLENSRALISLMVADQLFPAPHLIGLTEHDSAAEGERHYYVENMFALELFSWTDDSWAERMAAKIQYLDRSKRAAIIYANNNYETDILIMCARYENEYKPIFSKMKWENPPQRKSVYFPGIQCSIGKLLVDAGVSRRIVFMCVGEMGIAASTALTSHAISIYRPRLVTTLGMCCGFNVDTSASPSHFGDVLIARESACWEEGKYAELDGSRHSFKNRALTRTVDGLLGPTISTAVEMQVDVIVPILKHYLSSPRSKAVRALYGSQMRDLPEIKYGLVVSGSSVVADSEQITEILKRHPAALGLEMEIFGIYTAAQKSIGPKKPLVLGMKGVADFGDGAKHDKIQSHASILSFYTLIALLRVLYNDGPIEAV